MQLKGSLRVKLVNKNGYNLHRSDSDNTVTVYSSAENIKNNKELDVVGNNWILESDGSDKFRLKSWKLDYLHRPDSKNGVVGYKPEAKGNDFIFESTGIANEYKIKTWKGDYLYSESFNKLDTKIFDVKDENNFKWKLEIL